MLSLDSIRAMIFGHAIGDALGVPVEFEPRETLAANPVKDLRASDDLPADCYPGELYIVI